MIQRPIWEHSAFRYLRVCNLSVSARALPRLSFHLAPGPLTSPKARYTTVEGGTKYLLSDLLIRDPHICVGGSLAMPHRVDGLGTGQQNDGAPGDLGTLKSKEKKKTSCSTTEGCRVEADQGGRENLCIQTFITAPLGWSIYYGYISLQPYSILEPISCPRDPRRPKNQVSTPSIWVTSRTVGTNISNGT